MLKFQKEIAQAFDDIAGYAQEGSNIATAPTMVDSGTPEHIEGLLSILDDIAENLKEARTYLQGQQ